MIPPSPSDAASAAALRSDSRECWTTPGIDRDRHRLGGSLPYEDGQDQLPCLERRLRHEPPQRGSTAEPAPSDAAGEPMTRPQVALRRAAGRRSDGLVTG